MAIIFLFSTSLAVSLLVQCSGSKNVQGANAHSGDEVSFLQGQVEMKKSHSREAKRAEVTVKAEYSLGDACSRNSKETVSPPAFEQAQKIEVEPTRSAEVGEASVPATASPTDSRQQEPEKSSMVRGLLETLACVLVADVLRRCATKKKVADSASINHAAQASGQISSKSSLLTAALDGDEAGFEKAIVGVSAAQLMEVDKWGCTALHYAAKGGSPPIVRRLLDFDIQIEAIDACDETPLHVAARAGNIAVCKALLAAGACIDATNVEEYTPLVVAGQASQAGVCSLLIDRGAGVAGLDEQDVPSLVSVLMAQKSRE